MRYDARMASDSTRTFYEFFSGAGMARLGLGAAWTCLFANDFDPHKIAAYERHFGGGDARCEDVNKLKAADLPGRAALAWASFPCQDLSLAGGRGGLAAPRSGAFFAFWRLMEQLRKEGRAPRVIALENVAGLLTSRGGADFAAIVERLTAAGYQTGALMIDAAEFVPQSRPRLFIVGVTGAPPPYLTSDAPDPHRTPAAMLRAVETLSAEARANFVWWTLPQAAARNTSLADLIEWDLPTSAWRSDDATRHMLSQMSPLQRTRVEFLRNTPGRHAGALYRRIRVERGVKVQRAEARFDGLAGCLRTPGGGSSRQFLIAIENGKVRTRLMTPRETARLMGMPDDYVLPDNLNKALHLTGDGVAAPAVRHLAECLIEPLLDTKGSGRSARKAKAA